MNGHVSAPPPGRRQRFDQRVIDATVSNAVTKGSNEMRLG
jgi:hypothetical protein